MAEALPIDCIVQRCLDAYFSVVCEIQRMGFDVIVYNVMPTRTNAAISEKPDEYPSVGAWEERNAATTVFNAETQKRCKTLGIQFLENYPHLVGADGKMNEKQFFDSIHVSQYAMPFTLQKLNELYPEDGYANVVVQPLSCGEKAIDGTINLIRRCIRHGRR
jgi:hypothetical protein